MNRDGGCGTVEKGRLGGRKIIHYALNKHLLMISFVPGDGLALGYNGGPDQTSVLPP